MSLIDKILGRTKPVERVHVCQECGMPVEEHKEWCSILVGQRNLDQRAAAVAD